MKKILEVKNVSKVYKIYDNNFNRLKEIFSKKQYHKEFIANKNISFELFEGETLGIIGVNGAGKSTILKQIAGVVEPTSGEIIRHGRVTALLELGTGFNPELTGYDNIFLNGTLIGMTQKECEEKAKYIIEFSELGDYINEPIKTYSSGMSMRLAFSIAIHSEPQVLIVDEALSVGDAHFGAKCTKALRERKEKNMSIIYVSHDLNSLKLLCDRVILVNHGEVVKIGEPEEVINNYNFLISKLNDHEEKMSIKNLENSSFGTFDVEIMNVTIKGEDSKSDVISSGENAIVYVDIKSRINISAMTVGIMIRNKYGQDIFGTNTYHHKLSINFKENKNYSCTFSMPLNLGSGKYSIAATIHTKDTHLDHCSHWLDDACSFEIAGVVGNFFAGICRLEPSINIEVKKLIETNIKNPSIEEIMAKIKQEVEKRKTLQSQIETRINNTTIGNFEFKQEKKDVVHSTFDNNFEQKEVYEYADFIKYHDINFITNIYRIILKREPDINGLQYYLNLLRTGEKVKSEIISILRYSKEGKDKKVKILGSKKRYIMAALYSKPVIGYVTKTIATLLELPNILKRLNSYENYINQLHQISIDNDMMLQDFLNNKSDTKTIEDLSAFVTTKADKSQLKSIKDSLESKLNTKADKSQLKSIKDSLESKLNTKAEQSQLALYLQTVSYSKEYMKISQQNMQNLIEEAKKRLPEEVLNQKELLTIIDEEKHKYDNFYVEFEDKFRGTREDIKERLKVYLPYIEKLSFEGEFRSLDVGCGRGEWLELLYDNGYKNVKGLDLNRIMLARSKELGFNIVESDVIEYLRSQKDETLSLITGFHIIEHLPFEALMELFSQSYRVLKKGGMIIFETPNPENIVVGACNFYYDPTHRNPLPPYLIEFVAKSNSFKNVEIKRLNTGNLMEIIDNSIANYFNSSQDYSIIGYKE